MRRLTIPGRKDWQERVSSQGLTFHSRTAPYWNEEACYVFTEDQITELEKAANSVHELYLQGAQHVIDNGLFDRLAIDSEVAELVFDSWKKSEQHLYGRFDFAYDGTSPPKLLEYNADTPTSLLEASVIQWFWLQDLMPTRDQFNSLHEKLIDRWKTLGLSSRKIYFTTVGDNEEDTMTASYLQDTAAQAGFYTDFIEIGDIGYNSERKEFVDPKEKNIETLFKLYPWEWIVNEEFSDHIMTAKTRFVEPAWKMLWSNKGMLPILYELAPNHPNILPAYTTSKPLDNCWIRKPLLSREGANMSVRNGSERFETGGEYGEEGYVYQKYLSPKSFDGNYPVLGLWMIGDEACGMGIRESASKITDNLSRFTPHIIE